MAAFSLRTATFLWVSAALVAPLLKLKSPNSTPQFCRIGYRRPINGFAMSSVPPTAPEISVLEKGLRDSRFGGLLSHSSNLNTNAGGFRKNGFFLPLRDKPNQRRSLQVDRARELPAAHLVALMQTP